MKTRSLVLKRLFPLMLLVVCIMPMLVAFAPMVPTTPVVGTALTGLDGLQLETDPALGAAIQQFLVMGGFAALVAILINISRLLAGSRMVLPGLCLRLSTWPGWSAFFVLQVFFPNISITTIDEHMTVIAQILTSIFTYVYQYWISSGTHSVLSAGNVPLIGTSNTPKAMFFKANVSETKEAE